MWKLQPAESQSGTFYLIPGKEYVVGRKNCDILLPSDQSISRVHAHLTVSEQAVTLKDSSKYGTFVNDAQLPAGATRTLYSGDKITFGVFQSKFRLELNSVVVCSSCVDNEGKAALTKAVQSVGGSLVNSWSQDCTHLVMPTVKVTIKTICALLCCRPIVKPEFFTKLHEAVQRKESLPESKNFKPEIDEPTLTKQEVDLDPRPERKSLFKDKTFVFLSAKQMKRLSQAISCGGGKTELLDEGSLPVSLLESTQTCVIDVMSGSSQTLIPSTTKKWSDSVGQVLHRKGLRFITEPEIGLAAIYINNQTYCNPCISLDSESGRVRPAIAEGTLTQNATVDETVLPAASQNITAYAPNTEPSQGIESRMGVCGVTTVGETPEKRPVHVKPLGSTRTSSSSSSSSFKRSASGIEPPTTISVISESGKSSFSASEGVKEKKADSAPLSFSRKDESAKYPNSSTALKKSPQKQSALTSYFQPVNKKRPRDGSADSELSQAKLSRRGNEDEENKTKNLQSSFTSRNPISSQTSPKQSSTTPHSNVSASLGLGSERGTRPGPDGDGVNSSDSSQVLASKKRKEPEQDLPSDPEVPTESEADLNVSLEELESIMSGDMDEPVQSVSKKKPRLDQGGSGTASKREDNQRKAEKHQTITSQTREQGRNGRASSDEDLKRNPLASSEQEERHSGSRKDRFDSEDVKEEDVSFAVPSKTQNGLSKQESKDTVSASSDQELPRRLLQVQFMSLTVSAPSRTRSEPLQSRDPNMKNFKCFRKVPVPGLQGLPNIIGGSDLVAHNRSKNSELEGWLRDAAEDEKRQEREETLGDDLFRYNPRPSKRR